MDERRVLRWLVLALALVVGATAVTTPASAVAYGYDSTVIARAHAHVFTAAVDSPMQLRGMREWSASRSVAARSPSTTFLTRNNATEAASGASSAMNAVGLSQQLAQEEAASIFTQSGGLQPSVIQGSHEIIAGSELGNNAVIKALTGDGSNIADWGKFTTQTFQSPSGPFQVHFYYNPTTGLANYSLDFKAVFNG